MKLIDIEKYVSTVIMPIIANKHRVKLNKLQVKLK